MESVTRDDITIYFELNRDGTVNLRTRMVVVYHDHKGNEIKELMWPVYDHYKKRGTIKDQIDAVKKLKKQKNEP